jgi:hypothetical protein
LPNSSSFSAIAPIAAAPMFISAIPDANPVAPTAIAAESATNGSTNFYPPQAFLFF